MWFPIVNARCRRTLEGLINAAHTNHARSCRTGGIACLDTVTRPVGEYRVVIEYEYRFAEYEYDLEEDDGKC